MRPKVVLCGTYHRDVAGLKRTFYELEAAGCRVLYPISLDFLDTNVPIVRTATDMDVAIYDLEFFPLRGIRDVDFVWLHAPNGHVGLSTAFEIGYATAYQKPVFSSARLQDEMLDCQITVVDSVQGALSLLRLTVVFDP